ncbi:MAG: 1,2-phenylacetyl-CoA epoxidase subunit PaaC [Flavisolibacter sp.]
MNLILFQYCLHLADNVLILGQRNSEWTAHGPVLEQDIAITNISLDLLGQARNFYQYAALLYNEMDNDEKKEIDHLIPRPWKEFDRELNEDDLAFLRDERQYLNLLITELPKGDWAETILRQFFFSVFQFAQYRKMEQSSDTQLKAIAEKSLKEVAYHLRWSGEWVVRLGDGTEESNRRMNNALANLWPYTGELFISSDFEKAAQVKGVGADPANLKEEWLYKVSSVLEEATLKIPGSTWFQQGGKDGKHTEHLGYLLAEMQYLQRTYPNVNW